MKRNIQYILLAIIVCFACQTSAEALTIKDLLREMPDSIFPSLSKNNRLDFIDFFENDMKAEVVNALKGKTVCSELTDNMCRIDLSELTKAEMRILTRTDGENVICIVHSSKLPQGWDSSFRFYDTQWNRLNTSDFVEIPTTEQFIPQPADMSSSDYQNILAKAAAPLVFASFENDKATLNLTYTSSNANEEDFKQQVLQYVKPQQTLTLKNIQQ